MNPNQRAARVASIFAAGVLFSACGGETALLDTVPITSDAQATDDDSAAVLDASAGNTDTGTTRLDELTQEPADATTTRADGAADTITDGEMSTAPALPEPSSSQEKACIGRIDYSDDPAIAECPQQSCMPATATFVLKGVRLSCMFPGCKYDPMRQLGGGQSLSYNGIDLTTRLGPAVSLGFKQELFEEGYSLERFRKYYEGANLNVVMPVDGKPMQQVLSDVSVEFLDYRAGQLRFRAHGPLVGHSYRIPRAIPGICTTGHLPNICYDVTCLFAAEGNGNGTGKPSQVTVEALMDADQPSG